MTCAARARERGLLEEEGRRRLKGAARREAFRQHLLGGERGEEQLPRERALRAWAALRSQGE